MAQPVPPGQTLPWAMGLKGPDGFYLTVEPFGGRVGLTSKAMKAKQIFVLEHPDGPGTTVAIRTSLGRYLTGRRDGSLSADAEHVGADERFTLLTHADGRVSFQSAHGFFLGGKGEHVDAYGRDRKAEDRQFHCNLAVHPQMNIWNVNRKKFLHLKGDHVSMDEVIPWGDDAVLTLQFVEETNRYTLQTCTGGYLASDGSLQAEPIPAAQFLLEIAGGMVAFQGHNGRYLTGIGGEGLCRATKLGPPSRDELFALEDSQPQIKLTSVFGKKVSSGLTVALQANQTTTTDSEQFQIEVGSDGLWAIRSCKNKYVRLSDGQLLADSDECRSEVTRFRLEWHHHRLAICAPNRKYVVALKSGLLTATAEKPTEECFFIFEMTNRPRLVLRSAYGFLNTGVAGNLLCNKALPEVFQLHVRQGVCELKSTNGKFWAPEADYGKVSATSSSPHAWYIEFVELSKLALYCLTPDGARRYLQADKNGTLTCLATTVAAEMLFEY
jgi:fascin 1/2